MRKLNLLSWFGRNGSSARLPAPHLTFQSQSVARSLTRTGSYLKRRLWIFPIVAVVVLSIGGYFLRRSIESAMKESLRAHLETLLEVETAMLETWFKNQATIAETEANDLATREIIYKLLDEADPDHEPPVPLKDSPLQRDLQKALAPTLSAHDFAGYLVANKSKQILASAVEAQIGLRDIPGYEDFLTRALAGETNVSAPYPSFVLVRDQFGRERLGVPSMFVCAPVRDANFQIVGALGLRIRPENEFTRILQLGRMGRSGETYAFDKKGLLVSNSRFDDELMLLGLIPDEKYSRSLLTLQIRDPGGNMTQGFRPNVHRAELPLTRLAADAVAGNSGYDVDGYRNYRGVPSLGAWTWLPKFQIGVAAEIDVAEAYRPLLILRYTFWSLFALLTLSSIAIFVFSVLLARMHREAQKAAIASKKLGQYRLEQKLGAGAMGTVYKGFHAVLRRPTAIKLLDVDKVNEASIERFEREVQITSQLNHPNTVAIYDYGHTDEGVFYYAMEFLDGVNLQSLVDRYGPQSEARVIHILRQICGSLYEAHSLGLVHRDIKPANVMLNRRGAEPDVVKVLDFGLVKALDEQKQAGSTSSGGLTGTPLYMSPEAIQTPAAVDARSDLYAVGAVGYFLLTGKPVFDAASLVELCQQHITGLPDSPSTRLGRVVSAELESALLACLEKTRAKRPQTARELSLLLERCTAASAWSLEEADSWWGRHEREQERAESAGAATTPPDSTTPYDKTCVFNSNG